MLSRSPTVARAIRTYNDALADLYFQHRETVLQVQNTLFTQVLPNALDELGLSSSARDWVQEWLHDDLFIFRTLKKHKFTKAFALESLRTILTWRLTHLKTHLTSQDMTGLRPSPLHILPPPACDILGRPILILRVAKLVTLQRDPREHILWTIERLRVNLHNINSSSSPSLPASPTHDGPVLQYILLVDMENVSMRKFNLDLLTWYTHEVAPRYPGLFGTVFVINLSWTQSGLWSVIRLGLPESVQCKIFFPSMEVLHECINPSSLPSEYGGHLPRLPEIPNLLDSAQHEAPTPSLSSPPRKEDNTALPTHLSEKSSADRASCRKITSVTRISPRSQLNPFYGYPIRSSPNLLTPATLPYLRYGRRRKRDLIRTLAALWWEKWRSRVSWTFSLLFVFLCVRWWWRQRRKGVFFIRGGPN